MKGNTLRLAISAHMIHAPANGNGYFTRFRSRENLAMTPGRIPLLINMLAAPMRGAALVSIKKEELFLPVPVLHRMIFLAVKDLAMIFLVIAYWHSMLLRASASGIFKVFIMIFGTAIFHLRRL